MKILRSPSIAHWKSTRRACRLVASLSLLINALILLTTDDVLQRVDSVISLPFIIGLLFFKKWAWWGMVVIIAASFGTMIFMGQDIKEISKTICAAFILLLLRPAVEPPPE